MSSTVEATLERKTSNDWNIVFTISAGHGDLDYICIEKKVPRKHKDKAIWATSTHYKGIPVHQMLNLLSWYGFDISEFKSACIEAGWTQEVASWRPTAFCAGCGKIEYIDDLDHNGGFCLDCALERYANT